MTKKNISLCVLFICCLNIFSQRNKTPNQTYYKLNEYKKIFPNKIIDLKEIEFHVFNNDTLILIEDSSLVSIAYEPKDSIFLNIYKDVVYEKHISGNNKKTYMKLWKKPIKMYFDSSLDSVFIKELKKEALKLSSIIDSLKIEFVADKEKSNYVVYQIDSINKESKTEDIRNNPYIDYYLKWNQNRIYNAELEINLKKYGRVKKEIHINYLLRFFYKTLGRFYETPKLPCNSVFSSCRSNSKFLSEKDIEIIKYHYSYGICKFTDLLTFEEQHRKAKELLKNGDEMHFLHVNKEH